MPSTYGRNSDPCLFIGPHGLWAECPAFTQNQPRGGPGLCPPVSVPPPPPLPWVSPHCPREHDPVGHGVPSTLFLVGGRTSHCRNGLCTPGHLPFLPRVLLAPCGADPVPARNPVGARQPPCATPPHRVSGRQLPLPKLSFRGFNKASALRAPGRHCWLPGRFRETTMRVQTSQFKGGFPLRPRSCCLEAWAGRIIG